MANDGIYILTGPVQSGKTTALIEWAEMRNDVYGILTPVANAKRMFMDAHTREQFAMEAAAAEITLTVGRFSFSKENFHKAVGIIRDAMNREGWLIIDEIGPLELSGEGFHDILKEVLALRTGKLLLVVRENNQMTEKVRTYFNLGNATCITSITYL